MESKTFLNIDNFNKKVDVKLKQFTDKTNQIARAKYVPVATGKTMTSCKATKVSKMEYALSSNNYGAKTNDPTRGRYARRKANKTYKAYAGYGHKILVPAGKNTNKAFWFNRASEEIKGRFDWSLQ
jgi:hypothetical protein|nr:MAG TPA: hypothetical protein [Caudoviricetes sp.]